VRKLIGGLGWAAACTACSAGVLVLSVGLSMALGTRWHGSYEYYGGDLALYVGPALLGFSAPAALAWRARATGAVSGLMQLARFAIASFLLAVLGFSALVAVAAREAPPDSWWAYWVIAGAVGITSLLGAARVVWVGRPHAG
jgi:hypothetical protein